MINPQEAVNERQKTTRLVVAGFTLASVGITFVLICLVAVVLATVHGVYDGFHVGVIIPLVVFGVGLVLSLAMTASGVVMVTRTQATGK